MANVNFTPIPKKEIEALFNKGLFAIKEQVLNDCNRYCKVDTGATRTWNLPYGGLLTTPSTLGLRGNPIVATPTTVNLGRLIAGTPTRSFNGASMPDGSTAESGRYK